MRISDDQTTILESFYKRGMIRNQTTNATKFAYSDCSCNESDAYNNTLQADSNRGVPFTICSWLYTIQSYLESGKTASGHIPRKHARI